MQPGVISLAPSNKLRDDRRLSRFFAARALSTEEAVWLILEIDSIRRNDKLLTEHLELEIRHASTICYNATNDRIL
jgi:hypothetical protein